MSGNNPAVPGALNVSPLSGLEVVPLGSGPNAAQTTTGGIATLAGKQAANVIQDDSTARVLSADDSGAFLYFTNAGAITLTVPAGLGKGFEVGIVQGGAGQVTPTSDGTTINNRQSFTKTAGQWAFIALLAVSADTFVLTGDGA